MRSLGRRLRRRPPPLSPGPHLPARVTRSHVQDRRPGEGLRGRWPESRQCQVRWPERPRRGRPTEALGQGVGPCFHREPARCGCFLIFPGDKEKAVHTFGQMPNGLPGQFSFSRAGFPSEGAALTCVVVLAPSWPTRAWGLCCPPPPAPAGCSSQELGGEGREAGKQRLRSTSDRPGSVVGLEKSFPNLPAP